jgi:hypothetical protein
VTVNAAPKRTGQGRFAQGTLATIAKQERILISERAIAKAAPLGSGRLKLQDERLSRRLPQVCIRAAHVGRGAPEFEQRAIAHARHACAEIVNVKIGFQRNPG